MHFTFISHEISYNVYQIFIDSRYISSRTIVQFIENASFRRNEKHLEKLLLLGSTECGLTSFKSGSNNFGRLQEAAYLQNSIKDSNHGIILKGQLPEIEPTHNYDYVKNIWTWNTLAPSIPRVLAEGQQFRFLAVTSGNTMVHIYFWIRIFYTV